MTASPAKPRPGSVPRASGDFLARIAHALRRANARRLTRDQLAALVGRELMLTEPYLTDPINTPARTLQGDGKRTGSLSLDALERLNTLLPWAQLVDHQADLPVGSWWSDAKAQPSPLDPDHAVDVLTQRLDLHGMRVLDIGCLEGLQAIGLAKAGARVWAIDARIENVVKTLVRTWLAGVEDKVRVECLDVQGCKLSDRLTELGAPSSFDLVHHSAVLNHLMQPVEHLTACAAVCSHLFYLNTMVADCSDDLADEQVSMDGLTLALVRRVESQSPHVPFGGLQAESRWLTRDSLERLLRHLGFRGIQEFRLRKEGLGLRALLLASRQHLRPDMGLGSPQATDAGTEPTSEDADMTPSPAQVGLPSSGGIHPEADGSAARPSKYSKVVILGIGRSGTSAIASLLRRHGFFLGPDADEALHESASLRQEMLSGHMDKIRTTLEDWQLTHPRVAWKDPKIHTAGIGWLRTLPQDWLILTVFRDPVAIAQRRVLSDGLSFDAALALSIHGQNALFATLQGLDKKLLVLSYERLLQKPLAVINEVRDLLDLPTSDVPSPEDVWQAMRADQSNYRQAQDSRLAPQPTHNVAP
jgi:SAM-dependent methyltransferase